MPETKVKAAFTDQVVVLSIDKIVPQKEVSAAHRKGPIYKRIAVSLQHVGLIEPLVVFPRGRNDFLLLDGHLRLDILKSGGATSVRTIFAMDDEAYTYNKRVNHAPPIAEHFMILKALANGVCEERIAAALNVDVGNIRKKRDMLDGICPEAVETLRNSRITAEAFAALKKMKPARQIEAAEHMLASGVYSAVFAKALLQVTRPELLLETASSLKAKQKIQAKSAAARTMFEQETDFLVRDLKAVENSYGMDILTLTIGCAYLGRLLANERIERHLAKHHPEILATLRTIISERRPEQPKALAS